MQLEYQLSDEAVKQLFKAGKDYKKLRTLEFELTDLTEDARAKWLEMYGTYENVKLRYFKIYGGQIYEDGSVSSHEPYITDSLNWFVQDEILTPQSLSDVIMQLHEQYIEVKAELEEYKPKWQKALAKYQQKKAEEKAEEEKREAKERKRQKRLANLEWIQQLIQKLATEDVKQAEIERFCQKFQLQPEDLAIDDISDKPYVRLSVSIPVTIGEIKRTLEITNKTYHDIGTDEYDQWEAPQFSDLCHAIAQALAEIFNGEVKTVVDYNRGYAYLNVQCEDDTIAVATADLERVEW